MLIFRDEAHMDTCYLLVVFKRSKRVAKGLFYPFEKRFSGAGRAGTGPEMLMFRDEVHMDRCYRLVILKRSKKVVKGLCWDRKKRFSGAGRAGTGLRGRRPRNVSRELLYTTVEVKIFFLKCRLRGLLGIERVVSWLWPRGD